MHPTLQSALQQVGAQLKRFGLRSGLSLATARQCRACGHVAPLLTALGCLPLRSERHVGVLLREGGQAPERACTACGSPRMDSLYAYLLLPSARYQGVLLCREQDVPWPTAMEGSAGSVGLGPALRASAYSMEGEPIAPDVAAAWQPSNLLLDTRLSWALQEASERRALEVFEAACEEFADDPWPLLAYGEHKLATGPVAASRALFLRALACTPQALESGSAEAQRRLALSLAWAAWRQGDPERMLSDLLPFAERHPEPPLLRELTRASVMTGRMGLATSLLAVWEELAPEDVALHRAKVCTSSALDIGMWRQAWRQLALLASEDEDHSTAELARGWVDALSLPLPDWCPGTSRHAYAEEVRAHLVEEGWHATPWPAFGEEAPAAWHLVEAWRFERRTKVWIVGCVEARMMPHVETTLRHWVRRVTALSPEASLLVLSPYALPWSVQADLCPHPSRSARWRWEACGDVTYTVADEAVAEGGQLIADFLGEHGAPGQAGLLHVSRLMDRHLRDDGWYAPTPRLLASLTLYVAASVQALVPACRWSQDERTGRKVLLSPRGEPWDMEGLVERAFCFSSGQWLLERSLRLVRQARTRQRRRG